MKQGFAISLIIVRFYGCRLTEEGLETMISFFFLGGRRSTEARKTDSRPPSDEEYETGDNWSTASVVSDSQAESIPEEGMLATTHYYITKS